MDSPVASRRLNWLLTVALLAILVRCAYLWQISHAPFFALRIGDAAAYHEWALRIANGDWRGDGVFYQAPLYPYFLALVYRTLGDGVGMVRFVHAIVGAASCALLAAAGMALFGEAGALAGALLAIYPPAIFLDGLLEKSVLVTFFTALLLYLLSIRRTAVRPVLAGVALGLLALTRENALLLAVPIAAWLLVGDGRAPSTAWRSGAAFVLGCAIVLLPVAARNARVGREFALTTAQFGPNFYIGNHEGAGGTYEPLVPGHGSAADEQDDAMRIASQAAGRPLTPGEVSRFWTDRALAFVRAHPIAWAAQLARKLALTVNAVEMADTESIDVYAEWSTLLRVLSPFGFGVLFAASALGACLTARAWRRLWFLYAIALTYAASVVLFYVFARYRFPLVPVLALFVAGGVAVWRDAAARSLRKWACAAAACAAIVAFAPLENPQLDRLVAYVNIANAFSQDQRTWAEAAAFYDEALTVSPRSPAAHFGVGRLLARMHRPAEAIAHYRIAIDGWPDNEEIRADLALAQAAVDAASAPK